MKDQASSVLIMRIVLLCLFAVFGNVHAENIEPTEPLSIGISFSIPPWVIQENDSGIEIDILREALSNQGVEFEPVYLPFARAVDMFNAGKLDGLINARESLIKHGFLSDTVVTFQNVAVSLKSKSFPEKIDISFLNSKAVVAFQKAKQLLGPEFAEMASSNEAYQEVSKQHLQINLLFIRDVDFIVLDKSIFGYHWSQAILSHSKEQLRAQSGFLRPVTFHYLFEPSPYSYAFKDESMRDQFNAGLKQLKQSGRYDEIIKSYDAMRDLYNKSGIQEIFP